MWIRFGPLTAATVWAYCKADLVNPDSVSGHATTAPSRTKLVGFYYFLERGKMQTLVPFFFVLVQRAGSTRLLVVDGR